MFGYMQKNNIELITLKDEFYPETLKNIYDPPICLYVRGNKNILNEPGVAIIGCRKASQYR